MRCVDLRVVTLCAAVGVLLSVSAARLAAEPISRGTPEAGTTETSEDKSSQGTNPEIAKAIERFRARDTEGCLKLLKEAVNKDSDLPPVEVFMAQLASQSNVAGAARDWLEKATAASPDDPEAYVLLADIAVQERRITEADLLYNKAVSLMAGFSKSETRTKILQPRIACGLASTAESRGDWATAQKHIEQWLTFDPENALAIQQLAHARFQQKDVDGALEKLREAAKLDPDVVAPEATLAQYFDQAGDSENAKKWMDAALTAAPKDLKTRLMAAQWALETEQFDEAKKQADVATKLDPKSLHAKVLRGVIALFQKDYKEAELYFESAHLQAPGDFAAGNNLALALVEQKDEAKKRKALEYAEMNVRQFPRVSEAVATYGWVLYKLGRLEEAEQALRAVSASGNLTPATAFYIARISLDRNRAGDARQLLEAALRSPVPFAQREEAKSLLQQLVK